MSLKYTYKNKCNIYYIITVLQGSYLKVKKSTLANLKAKQFIGKNSRYDICKWGGKETQRTHLKSQLTRGRIRVRTWASQVALLLKNLPANAEDIRDAGSILGQEDSLEKGMATHSSTLVWRFPWTEEPGSLQSMGSQRVRHYLATQQVWAVMTARADAAETPDQSLTLCQVRPPEALV